MLLSHSYAHHPELLGRPQLAGAPSTSPLNVPMIILNVIGKRAFMSQRRLCDVGTNSSRVPL